MRLYDCFTFNDELDLLDIRLAELSSVVDIFVIAESPVTFQGKPKLLHYQENKARFSQYAAKIRHIVVDDMPDTQNPWERERHQRNSLKRGLTDAAPESMVLISDADEICTEAALTELKSRNSFSYIRLRMFAYFMNLEILDGPNIPWNKVYGAPWKYIDAMPDLTSPRNGDPQEFPQRYLDMVGLGPLSDRLIENGGWHFSWLGNADRILSKLHSFSHTEARVEKWKDRDFITQSIASRRFFPSSGRLVAREIDDSFPSVIRERKRQYLDDALLTPSDPPGRYDEESARRSGYGAAIAKVDQQISRGRRIASRLKNKLRIGLSNPKIAPAALNGAHQNNAIHPPVHVETVRDVGDVKWRLTEWIKKNTGSSDAAPTTLALMEIGFDRFLAMRGDESAGLELIKKTFTRAVERQRSGRVADTKAISPNG